MKTLLLYCCVLAGASAALPPGAPGNDRFGLIGPNFKQAHEVPSTLFNPFKSQANVANLIRKETATVSNEVVIEAVDKRGISGVVISSDATANHVVLGDEVFGVGDELNFPDRHHAAGSALVAGASIVLHAIHPENLELEIRVEGEAARSVTYPLHSFWAR